MIRLSDLGSEDRSLAPPIGITTRADAALPPAVQELVGRLRAVSGELYRTNPATNLRHP